MKIVRGCVLEQSLLLNTWDIEKSFWIVSGARTRFFLFFFSFVYYLIITQIDTDKQRTI